MGAGCHAVRLPCYEDVRVVSISVVAALLSKAQVNQKTTAARWAGRRRKGVAAARRQSKQMPQKWQRAGIRPPIGTRRSWPGGCGGGC